MAVSAKDVQALRQQSGAGILDCRRALEENEGNVEAAKRWLREQGLVGAGKRADRERSEGAVAVVVTDGGQRGAVLALECETDFVAKSADFVRLVDALTDSLATGGDVALSEHESEIDELKVTLKENIAIGRHERFETTGDTVLSSYLHVQNGRGVNGVLVEVEGGSPELAHDIAVHIAFARPDYLRREDVPQSAIDEERATIEATARNEGKPESQFDKIVEGRLTGWFKERVLYEQAYARDEKQTIEKLLGGAKVRRFAQVVVGS